VGGAGGGQGGRLVQARPADLGLGLGLLHAALRPALLRWLLLHQPAARCGGRCAIPCLLPHITFPPNPSGRLFHLWLCRFYSELIKFRRSSPLLGRAEFLTPDDITWHEDRWEDAESRFLALTLHDRSGACLAALVRGLPLAPWPSQPAWCRRPARCSRPAGRTPWDASVRLAAALSANARACPPCWPQGRGVWRPVRRIQCPLVRGHGDPAPASGR
jgi:hypothetical protein